MLFEDYPDKNDILILAIVHASFADSGMWGWVLSKPFWGFHDFPTLDGCRSWKWHLLFQTGTSAEVIMWLTCADHLIKLLKVFNSLNMLFFKKCQSSGICWGPNFSGFQLLSWVNLGLMVSWFHFFQLGHMIPDKKQRFFAASDSNQRWKWKIYPSRAYIFFVGTQVLLSYLHHLQESGTKCELRWTNIN